MADDSLKEYKDVIAFAKEKRNSLKENTIDLSTNFHMKRMLRLIDTISENRYSDMEQILLSKAALTEKTARKKAKNMIMNELQISKDLQNGAPNNQTFLPGKCLRHAPKATIRNNISISKPGTVIGSQFIKDGSTNIKAKSISRKMEHNTKHYINPSPIDKKSVKIIRPLKQDSNILTYNTPNEPVKKNNNLLLCVTNQLPHPVLTKEVLPSITIPSKINCWKEERGTQTNDLAQETNYKYSLPEKEYSEARNHETHLTKTYRELAGQSFWDENKASSAHRSDPVVLLELENYLTKDLSVTTESSELLQPKSKFSMLNHCTFDKQFELSIVPEHDGAPNFNILNCIERLKQKLDQLCMKESSNVQQIVDPEEMGQACTDSEKFSFGAENESPCSGSHIQSRQGTSAAYKNKNDISYNLISTRSTSEDVPNILDSSEEESSASIKDKEFSQIFNTSQLTNEELHELCHTGEEIVEETRHPSEDKLDIHFISERETYVRSPSTPSEQDQESSVSDSHSELVDCSNRISPDQMNKPHEIRTLSNSNEVVCTRESSQSQTIPGTDGQSSPLHGTWRTLCTSAPKLGFSTPHIVTILPQTQRDFSQLVEVDDTIVSEGEVGSEFSNVTNSRNTYTKDVCSGTSSSDQDSDVTKHPDSQTCSIIEESGSFESGMVPIEEDSLQVDSSISTAEIIGISQRSDLPSLSHDAQSLIESNSLLCQRLAFISDRFVIKK